MTATPDGVLRLEDQHTFNERALACVRRHEEFVWMNGHDTVIVHTSVAPEFFERQVHIVLIYGEDQYIARVIRAESVDRKRVKLFLSLFSELRQDVADEHRMHEQGLHIWARSSWRRITSLHADTIRFVSPMDSAELSSVVAELIND